MQPINTSNKLSPSIVFGVTLYNNSAFLLQALESLQNQSYKDFAVVMLDDCSQDGTQIIAQDFAVKDARFSYFRNPTRLGMLGTWRKVFNIAETAYPTMKYFAWASDHDLWDVNWLKKMVLLMTAANDAVMVFPLAQRIDENGAAIPHDIRKGLFSTIGCSNTQERFQAVTRLRRNFGNMVYGLYLAEALKTAGIYRDVLIPDRLLMQELSLAGNILQVEEVLWLRRFRKKLTKKTQLRSLWAVARPFSAKLPWEVVHTYWIIRAFLKIGCPDVSIRHLLIMFVEQLRFVLNNIVRRSVRSLKCTQSTLLKFR